MLIKAFNILFYLITCIIFSGCLEVIEEIELNQDGSGTANYTINLSQSKVKLGSIMQLDSINGKKIPTINDIENELNLLAHELENHEGIKNTDIQMDHEEFIYTISVDFNNINQLSSAINELSYWQKSHIKPTQSIYSYKSSSLTRKFEPINDRSTDIQVEKYKSELQSGSYICIVRSSNEVKSVSNSIVKTSQNKRAVMLRASLYDTYRKNNQLNFNIQY